MLHRIARPLFATWFVVEGLGAVRRPDQHVAAWHQIVAWKATWVPQSQFTAAADAVSDRQLGVAVRVHGTAMALAGVALAAGRAPRTAAATLAVLTLPTLAHTLLPTPRDTRTKEQTRARRARQVQLVSAIGGALIAASDTAGRPGLRWRVAESRARRAEARAQQTA
ncbi:MAG: DoxX family protein [Micrococcales bacterium]|nr:DoxX family protein [Micrococcales bacterium]